MILHNIIDQGIKAYPMSTHDEPNFLSLKNYYNPIIVQVLSIASLDIPDWSANTEATEFQQFWR